MSVVSVTASSQRPVLKPAIDFDLGAFDRKVIQPVRHNLAEHPLLQLDALRALARRLGEKQVRHHAITATAGSDLEKAPEQHKIGIGFDEALARIETAGSWIARVDHDLDDVLHRGDAPHRDDPSRQS